MGQGAPRGRAAPGGELAEGGGRKVSIKGQGNVVLLWGPPAEPAPTPCGPPARARGGQWGGFGVFLDKQRVLSSDCFVPSPSQEAAAG